ncbi:MAG: ChaN family lipoprotein [Bacteroidia bacterium]|nr:ChaN family lipoprotein [Bacteroidia bacterium]
MKNYKVYDSMQGKLISLEELVQAVADTDVLFFGEEHNDSLGHALQDKLYGLLLDTYGTVTLSLEMFETDCQQVLDEYLGGYISEDKMRVDARAWKNYEEAYRPMVERAKEGKQSVIAANAPRRYVNIVSRKGKDELASLPKSSLAYLPPIPIYTEDSAYLARFKEIMGQAGHSLQENIFHAQCTWDASMSYRVFQHWKKNKKEKIFHLNGRFHTDYGQGTMAQLRRYNKKVSIKNISCFRSEEYDEPDWKELSKLGDFIIISPQ